MFVAGTVYDVTSGVPSYIEGPLAMVDLGNGVYQGSFTPTLNHSYLVIMATYDDAGFTTPNPNRPPSAANYEAVTVDTSVLNFNYGTYDQNASLTLKATIFDLTDDTIFGPITMAHVALGVYSGQFQGVVGKNYCVVKAPTDLTRAPGADSFQCFDLNIDITIIEVSLANATLIGQTLNATLEATP